MKNIPQIIARAYLQRWPTRLRKSQFNVLSRYSWLKLLRSYNLRELGGSIVSIKLRLGLANVVLVTFLKE